MVNIEIRIERNYKNDLDFTLCEILHFRAKKNVEVTSRFSNIISSFSSLTPNISRFACDI